MFVTGSQLIVPDIVTVTPLSIYCMNGIFPSLTGMFKRPSLLVVPESRPANLDSSVCQNLCILRRTEVSVSKIILPYCHRSDDPLESQRSIMSNELSKGYIAAFPQL